MVSAMTRVARRVPVVVGVNRALVVQLGYILMVVPEQVSRGEIIPLCASVCWALAVSRALAV